MFTKAVSMAMKYTVPVVISRLLENDRVDTICASAVILNRDGWVVTSAHLFDAVDKKRIMGLKRFSFWWGRDDYHTGKAIVDRDMDIAIVKLEGFRDELRIEYPVFETDENMLPGRSVCRLGFPFHSIKASYDAEKKGFILDDKSLPLTYFPMDGMFTRTVMNVNAKSGRKIRFIETTTPGLRGQSGGPIFDAKGNLWGVQSHTAHLPLGFNPGVNINGETVRENQFLNVGRGVHISELASLLDKHDISYERVT